MSWPDFQSSRPQSNSVFRRVWMGILQKLHIQVRFHYCRGERPLFKIQFFFSLIVYSFLLDSLVPAQMKCSTFIRDQTICEIWVYQLLRDPNCARCILSNSPGGQSWLFWMQFPLVHLSSCQQLNWLDLSQILQTFSFKLQILPWLYNAWSQRCIFHQIRWRIWLILRMKDVYSFPEHLHSFSVE